MARTIPVNSGYTIINGSGTGPNGDRIDVWVEYHLGQQNILENYTPITVYFYAALAQGQHSGTALNYGLSSSLDVDGEAGTGVSNKGYNFTDGSYVNFLGSYSGNIAHNADGAKSISIVGSFTTLSEWITGGNVSASIDLPTIYPGLVSIDTGSKIVKAVPYIDNDGSWKRAPAYVDNGKDFKISV